MMTTRQTKGVLLAGFSLLLLLFGVVSTWMMVWPVLADKENEDYYYPLLPLSEDREEPIIDDNKIPPKQIYPPLSSVDQVKEGNWINIPSIGVSVPLVLSKSMSDKDVLKTLNTGAALYPNGIDPGNLGNIFIAAHSTGEPWKGKYRFAFLKINELTNNNLINIDFNQTRYTYQIVKKEIVVPKDGLTVESKGAVPKVTLMACWPLWSTQKRMLITAELKHITKLSTTPS